MPAEETMEVTGIAPELKTAVITGGAAGNHTVTGIRVGEVLAFVWHFTPHDTAQVFADLTSEFVGSALGITADNVITNTGGTDTSSDQLIIGWFAMSALLGI